MKPAFANIKKKTGRLALALLLIAALLAAACTGGKKPGPTAEPTALPVLTDEPLPSAAPTAAPEPTQGLVPHTNAEAFADVVLPREVRLNYFAIPDAVLALMTDGDIIMYKRVVTAYLAGQTHVDTAGAGPYPNLWRVVDMYFPLFFADVSDTSISEARGGIDWEYCETDWGHESVIGLFEEHVLDILASVPEDEMMMVRILSAYKVYTSGIVYDGSHTEPNDEASPYVYRHAVNAILNGTGVCWCFARGFSFILCQLGVESLTVHGLRTGDAAIHEWVCFRDGDEWRYCDPTWDIGGQSLSYFGYTINVREHQGYPERDVSVLEGTAHRASDHFNVSDRFFRPLYSGECWGANYEIDCENNAILFGDYNDGGEYAPARSFSLATGEVTEL